MDGWEDYNDDHTCARPSRRRDSSTRATFPRPVTALPSGARRDPSSGWSSAARRRRLNAAQAGNGDGAGRPSAPPQRRRVHTGVQLSHRADPPGVVGLAPCGGDLRRAFQSQGAEVARQRRMMVARGPAASQPAQHAAILPRDAVSDIAPGVDVTLRQERLAGEPTGGPRPLRVPRVDVHEHCRHGSDGQHASSRPHERRHPPPRQPCLQTRWASRVSFGL